MYLPREAIESKYDDYRLQLDHLKNVSKSKIDEYKTDIVFIGSSI